MKTLLLFTKRNIKLFFKDKGMFFTSLITPAILLFLYIAFLGGIYRDSFTANLPMGVLVSDEIVNGLVATQLVSSILAVSGVTVAFCSNFLVVQDKYSGTAKDFGISPVKPGILSIGYYAAAFISTMIICLVTAVICFVYMAIAGWYMSLSDVILLLLDTTLLVMFGTALSSVINFFLTTQGQVSAVGAIISSGYGFICGAYMPISSFADGLQNVISLLPGTYATSLIRNHSMGGALSALNEQGVPNEVIDLLKDGVDCNLYFFGNEVPIPAMYAIVAAITLVLIGVYVLLTTLKSKKK